MYTPPPPKKKKKTKPHKKNKQKANIMLLKYYSKTEKHQQDTGHTYDKKGRQYLAAQVNA